MTTSTGPIIRVVLEVSGSFLANVDLPSIPRPGDALWHYGEGYIVGPTTYAVEHGAEHGDEPNVYVTVALNPLGAGNSNVPQA